MKRQASIVPNSTIELDWSRNRTLLLALAMALFGRGSYIATRLDNPEAYAIANSQASLQNSSGIQIICEDSLPLVPLFDIWSWYSEENVTEEQLVSLRCDRYAPRGGVLAQITYWLALFSPEHKDFMTMSLDYSASLINYLSLTTALYTETGRSYNGSLLVSFDLGEETKILELDSIGMIVVSILVGTFITSILALALYACYAPTWTGSLDAFTMMRIGAALAKDPSLKAGSKAENIKKFDEFHGWIGDVEDEGEVGRLQLGGKKSLIGRRKYARY
jgi:hypothetical protein